MCPGETLLPLRIKYKQQHRSLRRTPTKRYKRTDMMQALIFTNLVGNREASLLRKVIKTRKATPSAIWCPQSLQELLSDLSEDWGHLRFVTCRPSCKVVLTSFTSQSHSPQPFHHSLSGWLVWLVEWENPFLLYFSQWRCNLKRI